MMKTLNFAVFGCGVIANIHAAAVADVEGATLVGCADVLPAAAEKFAEKWGVKAYADFEALVNAPEIDAISICTPSGTHADLAIRALEADKNVVLEKPMAITVADCDRVIAAAERSRGKITVISQLRTSPDVVRAKEIVESDRLGKIVLVELNMRYFRAPEYFVGSWRGTRKMDGGGALMNQGIHGIDVLQYLVGPVVSVSGVCKTLTRDIEVEDTANLIVEYASGAIGTIQGTTSVEPGYPRVIEISGTRGTIVIKEDVIVRWDVDGKELSEDQIPKGNAESFRNPAGFDIDNHKRQIQDLIDAIKENREPMVNVYEGKKPVDIILAAYESSKTGKKILLY